MYVATLISAEGLTDELIHEWAHHFWMDCTAGQLERVGWIDEHDAADLLFSPADNFAAQDCTDLAAGLKDRAECIAPFTGCAESDFDVIVQPLGIREKRLLVADMDSTMITVECIDELADYAGVKAEVSAVTEAAMRGELDFAGALDARVALLAGLDEAVIEQCLAERVRIMPGAETLVRTMRARGGRCVLVSGGFTRFAEPVGARIGFDRVVANVLEVAEGRLTGRVARPIVGADAKLAMLRAEADALGIGLEQTLAVGDGANDLPMVRAAGLGVAYHAKPIVAAAAGARIEHGDLTALLWAQGIPRSEWVTGATP